MENRQDRIVPVLIEDCDPVDLHLGLSRIQYVDYRRPTQEAVESLLAALDAAKARRVEATAAERSAASVGQAAVQPPRSHFHCGPWVPPQFFIGREEELVEAGQLIGAHQSFLVVGRPRAGKTSFFRKLMHDLTPTPDCAVLASYLNLQQCSELTIETFLENTILSIVGEMARKVFGCRYSDLSRPDPAEGNPGLADDDVFRSFVNIFRLVRERTHQRVGTHPQPLLTHDFVSFTGELLEIAKEKGRAGFVMFYDEANRLPNDISVNLLISIGEALVQTGLIGGYAASPEMIEQFSSLEPLFGSHLSLGPFESIDDMLRLLARYYFDDVSRISDLPVTPEAVETLWKISGGEPFLIQLAADRSFRLARRDRAASVRPYHVNKAHTMLKRERPAAFPDQDLS